MWKAHCPEHTLSSLACPQSELRAIITRERLYCVLPHSSHNEHERQDHVRSCYTTVGAMLHDGALTIARRQAALRLDLGNNRHATGVSCSKHALYSMHQ